MLYMNFYTALPDNEEELLQLMVADIDKAIGQAIGDRLLFQEEPPQIAIQLPIDLVRIRFEIRDQDGNVNQDYFEEDNATD